MSYHIASRKRCAEIGGITEYSDGGKMIQKKELESFNCRLISTPSTSYIDNRCVRENDIMRNSVPLVLRLQYNQDLIGATSVNPGQAYKLLYNGDDAEYNAKVATGYIYSDSSHTIYSGSLKFAFGYTKADTEKIDCSITLSVNIIAETKYEEKTVGEYKTISKHLYIKMVVTNIKTSSTNPFVLQKLYDESEYVDIDTKGNNIIILAESMDTLGYYTSKIHFNALQVKIAEISDCSDIGLSVSGINTTTTSNISGMKNIKLISTLNFNEG